MGKITIEERITDTRGRSTGFDYMRLCLASAVVFWHSFTTSYGNEFAYNFLVTPYRPIVAIIVPMFFALSGFLVAGSLFRNDLPTFVGLRALRIVPALTVETLLSAFFLGVLVTTTPLHQYFASRKFILYLCNTFGWIHYQLPGVFLTNPVADRVNGQLWTVPWELRCYLLLTIAALLRVVRVRAVFIGAVILLTIGLLAFETLVLHGQMDQENGVVGPALLLSFLSAVAIYLYRDSVRMSGIYFCSCVIVTILMLEIPGGDYLIGFPVAYITIYLGLLNPRKLSILRGADYSYGIYIYHYVIQQTCVFFLATRRDWYIVFPISLVLASIFAAASWRFVEKPMLSLRSNLADVMKFMRSCAQYCITVIDRP